MSLLNYITTLFPVFKRNNLIESCNLTQTSIREHTLPVYKSAEDLFSGQKFKSKILQSYSDTYSKDVEKVIGTEMLASISKGLENSLVILDYIGSSAKEIFSETEASATMTYSKIIHMRLIEASEFVNSYSRKFLNLVFILETSEADEHVTVKDSLAPAELKWLESNFNDFCYAMNIIKRPLVQIQKSLKELPDAAVTELTEKTFPSTLGVAKIDPFQMRHLSAAVNPFYYFGMLKAESQAAAYKAAKAELELLQLRKLNLEKLQANKPDAKVQKEIDYMQGRVSSMNYAITKMEHEYAG
jgi:hypothetical protein